LIFAWPRGFLSANAVAIAKFDNAFLKAFSHLVNAEVRVSNPTRPKPAPVSGHSKSDKLTLIARPPATPVTGFPGSRQGSNPSMTEPSRAVFLSYASQDAEAARRICEALAAAGIEVWFDQSELRGGDAWDQKIRREIHDCALFIPVISANTASRHEGYFRLEWNLADQRTHMIARNRAFIVPVCLDATPDAGADVPDSFLRAQWTRLPRGDTSPTFVEHVRRLLSPGPPSEPRRKFRPTPAIDIPKTRYAKSSGLSIAYQVIGQGPQDLVYVPGWLSNVEMMWENPALASFLRRLASFTRLIVFDKRGTGLSDRVTELPTLEQRMDDVRAVMDAVGSRRAALFGHSEGGCMCILFAATYPESTVALITYGAFAKRFRSEDYPWARTLEERLRGADELERNWGEPKIADLAYYAPSVADDASFQEWIDTYFRRSASPKAAADLMRMNSYTDVRDVLSSVRVPTLVLHAIGDHDVQAVEGRYIASRIAGARYVEFPSGDHWFWVSHQDDILGEIQELLTGGRPVPEHNRILATVLYADVVEGTKKAAALGDRRWRDLLESQRTLVRAELARHRGTEQHVDGNAFYATFDGPTRAVRCAFAARDAARRLGLEIRAGVHTGECEIVANKLGGIAAIIGARVKDLARPGEVLATSVVRDLVSGSGLSFTERGMQTLTDLPGEWPLFLVAS
jgi:pimeloyl-ACP methyl ester carboxylesterase